jgi:hypothetical protein
MSTILNIPIRKVFRGRDRRRRWGLAIPVVTFLALSLLARSSRAGFILSITNQMPLTATTGSFEVDLSNSSGSAVTVNTFSIELTLSNLPGVVFTGASTNTTDPYIFAGVGGAAYALVPGNPPFQFSYSSFPTTDVSASDSDWLSPPPTGGLLPAITVLNGAAYGLAVISYDTSAASAGTALINFSSGGTSASDSNFNPITLDYSSPAGSIVVTTTAVPEPSTLVLGASALASVLVAFGLPRAASVVARRKAKTRRAEPDLPDSP